METTRQAAAQPSAARWLQLPLTPASRSQSRETLRSTGTPLVTTARGRAPWEDGASTPPSRWDDSSCSGTSPTCPPRGFSPAPAHPPAPAPPTTGANALDAGVKPRLTERPRSVPVKQSARGSAEAAWLSRAAGGDGARGLPQGQVPAAAEDRGDPLAPSGPDQGRMSQMGEERGQAVEAATHADSSGS